MPTPSFTSPPPAPNRNAPSTFRERMDNFLAWIVTAWGELTTFVAWADSTAAQVALDRIASAASETAAALAKTGAEAARDLAEDHRDAAQDYAAAALGGAGTQATSATSWTIAAGSKSFVLQQTGKTLAPEQWVLVYRTSDPTMRGRGPITAVSNLAAGPNPTITVDIQLLGSTGGPYTDWTILQVPEPLADIASQAEAEAGAVGDKVMTPERTAEAIAALGRFAPDVILRDVTGSSTHAPALLDTVVRNVGSLATLSGSRFSLPAGTYEIWGHTSGLTQAAGFSVVGRAQLYNFTDSAVVDNGVEGGVTSGSPSPANFSFGPFSVTIGATKTFELRRVFAGGLTFISGAPVHTQVNIKRIS